MPTRRNALRSLVTLACLPLLGPAIPGSAPPTRVSVLSIDLNNLANSPPDSTLAPRMARLGALLRERLATACGYDVAPIDPAIEAAARAGDGYFYAHPDVAVQLAGTVRADWVIVPRLNRATPWVTDLQAHVIRVRDTTLISNRIVELKGLELGPDLAARLTERGAAWMADQVSQVIELASGAGPGETRRCPA